MDAKGRETGEEGGLVAVVVKWGSKDINFQLKNKVLGLHLWYSG